MIFGSEWQRQACLGEHTTSCIGADLPPSRQRGLPKPFRRIDPSQLPPVLDLEWNSASPTCPKRVPREQALEEISVMLSMMEQHTGKRPVIYTDITFHRDVLQGELKGYDFWLRSVAAEPEAGFQNRAWTFWQYTATGHVPGIQGEVDRNAFHGSEREWKKWVRER
jgi:lysozyme